MDEHTTPTAPDIARQLAAHPRWEWRAGMSFPGHIVTSGSEGRDYFFAYSYDDRRRCRFARVGTGWASAEADSDPPEAPDESVCPYLTDWPTIGVLFGRLSDLGRASLRRLADGWEASVALQDATTITARSPHGAGDAVATVLLDAWEWAAAGEGSGG